MLKMGSSSAVCSVCSLSGYLIFQPHHCHAGVSLHPYYQSLQPLLDSACFHFEDQDIPFIIIPPHFVPSARYLDVHLPLSLPRQLLSIFPAPRPRAVRRSTSQGSTITDKKKGKANKSPALSIAGSAATTPGEPGAGGNFLGVPGMNIAMDVMDVRKWNWGALTFGRGAKGGKSMASSSTTPASASDKLQREASPRPDAKIDMAALVDAMSSEHGSTSHDSKLAQQDGNGVTDVKVEESDQVDDKEEGQTEPPSPHQSPNILVEELLPPTEPKEVVISDIPPGLPHSSVEVESSLNSLPDSDSISPSSSPPQGDENLVGSSIPIDATQPPHERDKPTTSNDAPLPTVFSSVFHLSALDDESQITRRRTFYLTVRLHLSSIFASEFTWLQKDNVTFVLLRKDGDDWDDIERTLFASKAVPYIDKMLAVLSVEDEKM
jgi:hypothetical protein